MAAVKTRITGLEDVDEKTVEAARGMGMTEWEILRKVRLPLAMPVIFAGIRTSTVLNVGTAYLAFFIGGGGLGVWVVGGIQLFNRPQLLAGAITGALLAVTLDGALALAERRIGAETNTDRSTAAA
ncbi:Binding-protein-dependent transport system inner membrane component [Halogranum amylolyticum]|uniref:Binding-protein-dependent transport system inner membrane component n=1 Tax=Halogranum amylolyticum TaxID=660520 RepID=A0A1H8TGP1_9EURY|nr:ABC transporter permease subunit [Halogranum amylolyticum]SEO90067.1 Binding-protein-dependent transport system inner membrane component [Halogranum amylolyticum]